MGRLPTYVTSDGRTFSPGTEAFHVAVEAPLAVATMPAPQGVRLYEREGNIGEDWVPGAWFFTSHEGHGCPWWDNCDGRHFHVVTPDGAVVDLDGRAANCTMRDERTHRCWVRHGAPPHVTANKNGATCAAGAGSIQTYGRQNPDGSFQPGWHGFLRNGVLVDA